MSKLIDWLEDLAPSNLQTRISKWIWLACIFYLIIYVGTGVSKGLYFIWKHWPLIKRGIRTPMQIVLGQMEEAFRIRATENFTILLLIFITCIICLIHQRKRKGKRDLFLWATFIILLIPISGGLLWVADQTYVLSRDFPGGYNGWPYTQWDALSQGFAQASQALALIFVALLLAIISLPFLPRFKSFLYSLVELEESKRDDDKETRLLEFD